MGDDILKKPVHLAILKPSHIQKLASEGKLKDAPFAMDANLPSVPLPAPAQEKQNTLGLAKLERPKVAHSDLLKKNKKQMELRVIHDRLPPIPEHLRPPCSSCKTAACCYAFAVNITKEEYDSGLYGDAAVQLTEDMYQQLKSKFLLTVMLNAPRINKHEYFLEGKVGEPCPFLSADGKCGIYDIRPATCRVYTCVGDPRITEGMRQGTEGLNVTINAVVNKRNNAK